MNKFCPECKWSLCDAFGRRFGRLAEARKTRSLLGYGLGLRYQLTRRYPMHMRFDYAWGKNESLFYFSVSEAF